MPVLFYKYIVCFYNVNKNCELLSVNNNRHSVYDRVIKFTHF